ncbi:hypothetical protein ORI20_27650 [Mycobacterium sp. CVI_P3]|uniref:Uncharacterized protein n=1 Tax=Mycobacterium pinniadriaticum TaxID=2994102 RepID=A0ABT3SLQ5_9MYCO|nr:hypothetical protein [Mycobacterium pinniadriaticum]MCX2934048.1 hypothetical protein [Mycobacterium pinniadriaticum]MCX2940455.1 hypothetical protein [Mycobacterium pinniadriaticum]
MKVVKSKKPTEWYISAPFPPQHGQEPAKPSHPRPQLVPTIHPQDVARERRRKGLSVQYVGDFSLSGEVRGMCAPLAAEMTVMFSGRLGGMRVVSPVQSGTFEQARELPFRAQVAELAGAVHELMLAVAALLGDRQLGSSASGRSQAAAVVSDPAHAGPPQVTDEDVKSGAWVEVLAGHVAGLDVELAAQLGRAALPDGLVSDASWAVSELLGREFTMKLRHLEGRVPGMKMSLQGYAEASRWAAAESERRAQQRLQRLGLA